MEEEKGIEGLTKDELKIEKIRLEELIDYHEDVIIRLDRKRSEVIKLLRITYE